MTDAACADCARIQEAFGIDASAFPAEPRNASHFGMAARVALVTKPGSLEVEVDGRVELVTNVEPLARGYALDRSLELEEGF